MDKDKCNLCKKDRKNFEGCVWYSGELETNLCRSCYLKWCKNKECKSLKEKYKKAKPCTKLWDKMCKEQQKAFNKWFEKAKVSGTLLTGFSRKENGGERK